MGNVDPRLWPEFPAMLAAGPLESRMEFAADAPNTRPAAILGPAFSVELWPHRLGAQARRQK
jgi:hypothetical protein